MSEFSKSVNRHKEEHLKKILTKIEQELDEDEAEEVIEALEEMATMEN